MKTESKSILANIWKKHRGLVIGGALLLVILVLFLMYRGARNEVNENKALVESVKVLLDEKEKENKQLKAERDEALEHTVIITDATLSQAFAASAELVTQKYIYTNAAKYESNDLKLWNWTLPFGTKSIVVTYDGVVKAGIDLKSVTFQVNEEALSITVTLPEAAVTDNNIPQETITVVEVKNGLFNEITLDDYNLFISEQKVLMEQRAIDNGLLTQATEEAQRIIETTLMLLPGIDRYTIHFQ